MIFGLETRHPLPDKWTPVEALALVKCLDENGELRLYQATTTGLTSWEALGMLTAAAHAEADHGTFEDEDEDDD